jgi:multisubunit Na+/H+ antiporter MnhB subunit
MSFYSLAADAMVAFHAAYVGFVLFGMVAILIGIVLRWRWVRNFWFRTIHFVMIAVVVAEALCGVICPLTTWEDDLREMAGETVGQGTFVGRLCNALLFYQPSVDEDISGMSYEQYTIRLEEESRALQRRLAVAYCVFGAAVLLTVIFAPPQRPTGPRWLVRRWERQALQGWHQRLRLHRWLSRPEVGWLVRFLSQIRQMDRMHHRRNPPCLTPPHD